MNTTRTRTDETLSLDGALCARLGAARWERASEDDQRETCLYYCPAQPACVTKGIADMREAINRNRARRPRAIYGGLGPETLEELARLEMEYDNDETEAPR